jgi:hypothetical protein
MCMQSGDGKSVKEEAPVDSCRAYVDDIQVDIRDTVHHGWNRLGKRLFNDEILC